MQSEYLFRRTRLKLAGWYAGVMGATVLAGGLLLYNCLALVEARWFDHTVADLAGTLHDYLLPQLDQPGHLDPQIASVLLGVDVHEDNLTGVTRLRNYYVRLLDQQGQLILQTPFQPVGLTVRSDKTRWQTYRAADGTRYRQLDDYLHTHRGEIWGYLQLGRSMAESDAHLNRVKGLLILSTPIAMLGVGWISWWLAGLAMQPIIRSYRQIQQFSADAAHELRTPLATIRTLVHTSLGQWEQGLPIRPDSLKVIERQNDRLSHLVSDLLLLSRMEEAQPISASDPICCLNDLIADLQEELAPLANSAQVDLQMELPNSPLCVAGEVDHLYRLVANLITNGLQYTPAGGAVKVQLSSISQKAVIAIEDTGVGIPPQAQPFIFDRFYRVDGARARHTGGTGLGLSIAQVIAQHHGGSIQVKSQPGSGSVFTITLPLASPRPTRALSSNPA